MGLKSIKLFEESFVYDRIVKGGVVTEEENKTFDRLNVSTEPVMLMLLEEIEDNRRSEAYVDIANTFRELKRVIEKSNLN